MDRSPFKERLTNWVIRKFYTLDTEQDDSGYWHVMVYPKWRWLQWLLPSSEDTHAV